MKRILLLFIISIFVVTAYSQYIPLNHDLYSKVKFGKLQANQRQLWSMKPFLIQSVDSSELLIDDVFSYHEDVSNKCFVYRKLFAEHLINYKNDWLTISIDPLFDFTIGKERQYDKKIWRNTRGIDISGNYKDKLVFSSQIFETQSFQPSWIKHFADSMKVIPGQGPYKRFKTDGFDYYNSSGYVTYIPDKRIYFTVGYGKNFIGEGYRSLILSDAAYNYPYVRLDADFRKIKYTVLYAQFTALNLPYSTTFGYERKWSTMHFLQVMLFNRLNVGLFDAIIWENRNAEEGYRGFEFHYLNPIVFLRPAEFAIGSPDNYMIGTNISYSISNNYNVYAQLLLDEFNVKNLFKDNKGWWGNKYSIQLGVEGGNMFNISNLYARAEYNQSRPYTYTHNVSVQSYSHANQPLAHILGANFREGLFIASYSYKNWQTSIKYIHQMYGADTNDISYGQNLLLPYTNRKSEYDNYIGQGLKTKVNYVDYRLAYVLNRKTNMKLEASIIWRTQKNDLIDKQNLLFSIGFRTNLSNFYYEY